MRRILLSAGESAMVDDEDYHWLSQYEWYLIENGDHRYASRTETRDSKSYTVLMHREILGVVDRSEVDHINNDGLDNRRHNLRRCSHTQNMQNRVIHRNNKSGFKGVWFCSHRWRVAIRVNNKPVHLGYYDDKIDAARAYNKAASAYFGEFAKLNQLP